MTELSIIIPARNEIWLAKTIDNILENIEGNTEIIATLDGYWPNPPIKDNPRVHLLHHMEPVGQRKATNEAARLSEAKFIMKCDAHCAFDKGFDVKLMADFEYDWTVIPRMYNLHGFNWKCKKCGFEWYMGPDPIKCEKCDNITEFEKIVLWEPRKRTRTDFMRFDSDLHFQYWRQYERRPGAQGDICEGMSLIGACWIMHRDRFFELDGLDEEHGSWGQMGTEIACKSWLSGGRLMVNKKTWFAHMFRTRPGFGFPYHISSKETERAREYSRHLWLDNAWMKAVHPLSWLIEKFAPVPGWEDGKCQHHTKV